MYLVFLKFTFHVEALLVVYSMSPGFVAFHSVGFVAFHSVGFVAFHSVGFVAFHSVIDFRMLR